MKKFITALSVLVLAMTACQSNSSYVPDNSFVEETVTVTAKSPQEIYYEHKDSLMKFGVGYSDSFKLYYSDMKSGYNIGNVISTNQYFIKTHLDAYYYNANTRKNETWGTEDIILVFKDKAEMKEVLTKSITMINNGYAKKVANDDYEDFPIIGEYELRIERGSGITSYTLYKFSNNKQYKTESAWVTKKEMQQALQKL